ncbi:hypothetical protein [Streptomyces sp. NBC_01565]|uniref:hypothetical protein n=1 Tax=unclassified Streptomyces TaxID=2593676 RepID=UPI00225092F5|nr:hypothetical protein [Streptomyces sp. NBC_01565]MCX4547112.1 hypothetical protein [Streptomyces sp. NBC_01565]
MTADSAVLTFADGFPPVDLDDAELTVYESGSTSLAGWARPGAQTPSGEQCLPLIEHCGRRWAVADVRVDVSSGGGHRDRVDVSWHSGHELEAVDPYGRYRVDVAWLLRARTLKLLELGDLIDQITRHAVTLASGNREPQWARRLELACNEVASRDPLVTPRRSRRCAEADPLRLLHDVMTAGGHLATTTGTVRARAESADQLARLSLVTVPRRMPSLPNAPVLLVNSRVHTLGLLRACEDMVAEERARIRARTEGAPDPIASAGDAFKAECETLLRRYTPRTTWRRRPSGGAR